MKIPRLLPILSASLLVAFMGAGCSRSPQSLDAGDAGRQRYVRIKEKETVFAIEQNLRVGGQRQGHEFLLLDFQADGQGECSPGNAATISSIDMPTPGGVQHLNVMHVGPYAFLLGNSDIARGSREGIKTLWAAYNDDRRIRDDIDRSRWLDRMWATATPFYTATTVPREARLALHGSTLPFVVLDDDDSHGQVVQGQVVTFLEQRPGHPLEGVVEALIPPIQTPSISGHDTIFDGDHLVPRRRWSWLYENSGAVQFDIDFLAEHAAKLIGEYPRLLAQAQDFVAKDTAGAATPAPTILDALSPTPPPPPSDPLEAWVGFRVVGTPVGVAVAEVLPRSCAGPWLQRGDVLAAAWDGQRPIALRSPEDVLAYCRGLAPGQQAAFTVRRHPIQFRESFALVARLPDQ